MSDCFEAMPKRSRFDDDLLLPTVKSSWKTLRNLSIFTRIDRDTIHVKIDKERPELGLALDNILLPEGISTIVMNSGDGAMGIALAAQYRDNDFFLYDPIMSHWPIMDKNVSFNASYANRIRRLDTIDAIRDFYPQAIIGIVPPYQSNDIARHEIELARSLLPKGGRYYLLTHKKKGAATHTKYVKDVFGEDVEIARTNGGYRIIGAIKQTELGPKETSSNIRRTVTYNIFNHEIKVETEPSLFSKDGLDHGTRLLLEAAYTNGAIESYNRLLDVGCGWGAIGIASSIVNPAGEVVMTDVDIRATRVAQDNILLNRLEARATALATNDLDTIHGQFDLILSNPPFHIKNTELEFMFRGIRNKLARKGQLYFVVEKQYVSKFFDIASKFFSNLKILHEAPDGAYSIFCAKK